MARFEQRIPEEEVIAARRKIAAGASLRSAAAEIPYAASTLSDRIKKAKAAEVGAYGGAVSGENEGTLPGDIRPLDVLREALLATKTNGQPDWPTRLAAVRALAALRPEELDHKEEEQPTEPEIVVYDLLPGAVPVLHRAQEGAEAPVSPADAQPAQPPTSSSVHMFSYQPGDGESVLIGVWSPAHPAESAGVVTVTVAVHKTDDGEEADRWKAELSAGRLPESGENVP